MWLIADRNSLMTLTTTTIRYQNTGTRHRQRAVTSRIHPDRTKQEKHGIKNPALAARLKDTKRILLNDLDVLQASTTVGQSLRNKLTETRPEFSLSVSRQFFVHSCEITFDAILGARQESM